MNSFGFPRFKAIDGNGNPLRGGNLYTYIAGTTTNKATYTNVGLTTPHANPVVLNSDGEALIYLQGSYNMNLTTSAGAQVPGWPINNIRASDLWAANYYYPDADAADQGATGNNNTVKYYVDTIGATNKATIFLRHDSGAEFTDYIFLTSETITSNITFEFEPGARLAPAAAVVVTIQGPIKAGAVQIFTVGAGTITLANSGRLKEIYAQWWGAMFDAIAPIVNDTAAFNAARTALSNGGTIALPQGVAILENWSVNQGGINVKGAGAGITTADSGTILRALSTLGNTDYVVRLPLANAAAASIYRSTLRDLMIDGNSVSRGLRLEHTAARLEAVTIRYCASYCVYMEYLTTDPSYTDSLDGGGIFDSWIYGAPCQLGGGNLNVKHTYFNGAGSVTPALIIKSGHSINITDACTFESYFRPVIDLSPAAGYAVRQVSIERCAIGEGAGGGTITVDVGTVDGLSIKENFFAQEASAATTLIDIDDEAGGNITVRDNWAQRAAPIVLNVGSYGVRSHIEIANNNGMDVNIIYARGPAGANMVASGNTTGWKDVKMDKTSGLLTHHEFGHFKGRRLKTTDATPILAFAFPTEPASVGHWRAKVLAYDTSAGAVNIYHTNAKSVTAGAVATVTDIQTIANEGTAAAACAWQATAEVVELFLTGAAAANFTWMVDVEYDYIKN